ncbi:MAG: flagellar biosynthetic protein FliR [Alphaproteobacteria bacterium]|nr:flagellar biosynthetic protein FliR [Alphaproteobacteria bacterium]
MNLEDFLATGVFAFMLTFVRIGTAATIMPGIGDSFTPANIRLFMALGLTAVIFPMTFPMLPQPLPGPSLLAALLAMEFVVGLLIGTVARIFMAALDTAGMVISMTSGLGNAQLFNPASATQGSLIGAFLSVTGTVIVFATNTHHLLFYGLVGSYEMFPVGAVPDSGGMAEMIAKSVSASFAIGVQLAAPFLVLSMLIYIGMGVLSRLMPAVQVFLLALPLQIMLSFVTMGLVVSALFLYWLHRFEDGMTFFLRAAGG